MCLSKFSPQNIQDIGAVATVAAVVIALFRDTFIARWNRAKLDMRFSNKPPDYAPDPSDPHRAFIARLFVLNTGRSRVEKVQVVAEAASRMDESGEFALVPMFFPMPLRWSFEYLAGSEDRALIADGIPRGAGQHCDLGILNQYAGDTRFLLATEVRRVDFEMRPGSYRLHLRIAASNADAIVRTIQFTVPKPTDARSQSLPDAKILKR